MDEDWEETFDVDKEDDENEKIRKAYETINRESPIVPGLGKVEPIKPPKEKIELDQDEIPWELKDAEDASEEDE